MNEATALTHESSAWALFKVLVTHCPAIKVGALLCGMQNVEINVLLTNCSAQCPRDSVLEYND